HVDEAAVAALYEASGLPIPKCDVHKIPLGGGFGRRTAHDFVHQAVAIAKQIPGTPVKLIWSREEDMTHGRYHPVTQAKMVGAFDASNNLTALHMRISGQSILAFVNPQNLQNGKDPFVFQGLNPGGTEGAFGYTIPNLLIDHAMRNPHIPPHFYRGVAQHMGYGSYVAACAEVSVDKGAVKIHRIIAATDPGHAVNPAQIERQIAGSFVYGLSALFFQECTVKDGRIEQTNFDSYDSMRI